MQCIQHSLGTYTETDVLILGSGASGVGAALGAADQGCRVLIMDKGKLESSGCAGGGNDHYMAILDEDGAEDCAQALVNFYHKPLNGWSPANLTNGWYGNMRSLLLLLEQAGVQFAKTADGRFYRTQGFGQPGRWWTHITNGMTLKRNMAKLVRARDIEVLDHVMAVKIMTDRGQACGVLGWNVLTGEFHMIRAKTVVSAQGRSATRSSTNSTGNPYNVWMYPYNTGAGLVLGYDAGAELTTLDSYQRSTLLPKGYGCPGMNGINSSGAHELNALGERFMGKYDPMWENGVRNSQIHGTFQELQDGKGPPFYMDMRHVDPEVVRELQDVLMPGDKATFGDWAACTGTDFQHTLLEVEIGELIFGGMIAIDDIFESTVPGLFNGSVFLYCSGALCGGYEAGKEAAHKASGMVQAGQLDEAEVAQVREDVFAPLQGEGDLAYAELEEAARNTMMYYMGYRRSVPGMERALEKIRFLKSHVSRLHASSLRELMRCHEAREVVAVCELAILASLQRKESGRCVYTLTDYPHLDPDMARPVHVRKDAVGPVCLWGPWSPHA